MAYVFKEFSLRLAGSRTETVVQGYSRGKLFTSWWQEEDRAVEEAEKKRGGIDRKRHTL